MVGRNHYGRLVFRMSKRYVNNEIKIVKDVQPVSYGCLSWCRAEEGHVEAMAIDNGAWAYAVQWHPEDNAADNAQQAGLFAKFVEQAKNAPLI